MRLSDQDRDREFEDILPSQYLHPEILEWTPWLRLAAAVLEDAVACAKGDTRLHLCRTRAKHDRFVREARSWLLGYGPQYLAIVDVCDGLRVNLSALQGMVRRTRPRGWREIKTAGRTTRHQATTPVVQPPRYREAMSA